MKIIIIYKITMNELIVVCYKAKHGEELAIN